MRTVAWDTRNQTMAEAVAAAYREYPQARIVAYGGQLHMLRNGRYMYDSGSRVPVGARLPVLGVPATQICSVILEGQHRFPLSEAWKGKIGAIDVARHDVPASYLMGDTIYGVDHAADVMQYFVNVGPVTNIRR